MVKVAEAIDYAHRRGVIHRDLKPGNILLDRSGNPRVTDFGLAKKLQGDSGLTGSGQIMGTPSYMPPEQAGGNRGEIGPAADVYALGATLYALLTGRPPFQAATAMDTVLMVLGEEPVPPRRLNASIPLDLETICLKCLEKEPARRYTSAAALAEELGRYLSGEPILARPIGDPERVWRWCRRRPVVAGLSAAVAALILFVAIAGPLVALSQARLRALEETRRLEAEQAGYEAATKALAADQALVQSDLSQAQNLHHLAQLDRQGRALELLKRAGGLKRDTDGLLAKLRTDPDGLRGATAGFWREQQPRLRSEAIRWLSEYSLKPVSPTRFPVLTQSQGHFAPPPTPSRSGLAASDDGKWLAYSRVGIEGTDPNPARFVEIIEADTGKVAHRLKVGPYYAADSPTTVAFDQKDEDVLLARMTMDPSHRRDLRFAYLVERWSRLSGALKGTVSLPMPATSPQDQFFGGLFGRLVFSPDRRSLLSIPIERHKPSIVWDLAAAKPRRTFEIEFTPEAFFPDGGRIIGMIGSEIVVRDIATGGVTRRWPMPDQLVSILGNLRASQRPIYPTQADTASLWVSPDGRWVAAIGQRPSTDQFNPSNVMPRTIFLFDAESAQVRARIPNPDVAYAGASLGTAPTLAFDADSRVLAVATTRSLSLFSVPGGTPLISEPLPDLSNPTPGQPRPEGAGQGSTISTNLLFARGASRLFSAVHPSSLFASPFSRSPSAAAQLVVQGVQSWDVALARARVEDRRHDGPVRAVKFEPGDRLVAAGDDRVIRTWDRGGGLRWSVGHPGAGSLYRLVARDQTLEPWRSGILDATGTAFFTALPGRIDVWDAATGERRGSFPSLLAMSPDRRYLVIPRAEAAGQVHELSLVDVSRDSTILSIPLEQKLPRIASARGLSRACSARTPGSWWWASGRRRSRRRPGRP